MTSLNASQSQSRDDEIQRTGKKPALNEDLLGINPWKSPKSLETSSE
jgi:hypothetical protein